ncbi:hypothetical protein CYY_002520 [Polysphondylium violaceum]|uniref:Uncharacterized protein n=1 Tax=Polysphondylium violaceum TaxID=133409 RepID=A0A8J4Q143_9MYCE|nr:hypothetical protein CYY_002520 [Polysphondylium violaceum]
MLQFKYIFLVIAVCCISVSFSAPPNNFYTFNGYHNDTYLYTMGLLSYEVNVSRIYGQSFQGIIALPQVNQTSDSERLVIYLDDNLQTNLGTLNLLTGQVDLIGGFSTPNYLKPYNIIKQSMGYDMNTKELYYAAVFNGYVYMVTCPLGNAKPIVVNTAISCNETYYSYLIGTYNLDGNFYFAVVTPQGYTIVSYNIASQSIVNNMGVAVSNVGFVQNMISYQGTPYIIQLRPASSIFNTYEISTNQTSFMLRNTYTLPYSVNQINAIFSPGYLNFVGSNSVPTSTSYLVTMPFPNFVNNPIITKFPANLNTTSLIFLQ